MGKNLNYALIIVMLTLALILGWTVVRNKPIQKDQPPQWQNWDNKPKPKEESTKPKEETPKETYKVYEYAEAIQLAQKSDKKMFVYFYADWCGYCNKMKAETFSNDQVKKSLENYIVTHVNTDKDIKIARRYFVSGLPSYVVADKNEKVDKRSAGFKTPNEFVKWLVGGRF